MFSTWWPTVLKVKSDIFIFLYIHVQRTPYHFISSKKVWHKEEVPESSCPSAPIPPLKRFWEKWRKNSCDSIKIGSLNLCNKSRQKYISVSKNNLEFVKKPLWSNKSQGQYLYIHVNWQFSILNFKFEYIGNSSSSSARMRFVLGIDKR